MKFKVTAFNQQSVDADPDSVVAPASVTLKDTVFKCEVNEGLVHQLVTWYQAGGRQGSKAQKTRSEVSGGGRKPHAQKGTGRARAGTIRSPIWRSGGVTFAAKPRDYTKKLNKKMYRVGMRSIWSELVSQKRLIVVNDITVESPKTKELLAHLNTLQLDDVLMITDKVEGDIYLAARNIMKVDVRDVAGIDPVSLLSYGKVLLTVVAVKQIEEMLG